MKVLHRDMKSANVFLMKDPAQDFYCVKIGELLFVIVSQERVLILHLTYILSTL